MYHNVKLILLSLILTSELSAVHPHSDKLIGTAQKYLQFIHDVGSAQSVPSDDPRIEKLFAKDLTKIDNRSPLFENCRNCLLSQMRSFKKEDNPLAQEIAWMVDIKSAAIFPSAETNSVTVQFEWKHMHVGRATTTAILVCDADGKIKKIIDVWAPIQD